MARLGPPTPVHTPAPLSGRGSPSPCAQWHGSLPAQVAYLVAQTEALHGLRLLPLRHGLLNSSSALVKYPGRRPIEKWNAFIAMGGLKKFANELGLEISRAYVGGLGDSPGGGLGVTAATKGWPERLGEYRPGTMVFADFMAVGK
jgi:hypothetical protein